MWCETERRDAIGILKGVLVRLSSHSGAGERVETCFCFFLDVSLPMTYRIFKRDNGRHVRGRVLRVDWNDANGLIEGLRNDRRSRDGECGQEKQTHI